MSEQNVVVETNSSPVPTEPIQALANDSWLAQLSDILSAGGPVVIILSAMSVLALAIVLYKAWQFYLLKLSNRESLTQVLNLYKQGKHEQAFSISAASTNPVLQVMHKAMLGRHQKLSETLLREEVQRVGSDALFELRKGFRPLEVIASLAPLLGLLGTVLGMIEAFKQLSAAGSKVNPAILSAGIWEALLTTAVGLIVAIPVVTLLTWLERRVDQTAHDMENYVTQIFTLDIASLLIGNAEVNSKQENKLLNDEANHQLSKSNELNHESAAIA